MKRNQKDFTRTAILLLMTILAVGIVKWTCAPDEASISVQDGSFELSVWISDNLCVNWWKNETDNTYCIFIPGAVKNQKLRLTFGGIQYAVIAFLREHTLSRQGTMTMRHIL